MTKPMSAAERDAERLTHIEALVVEWLDGLACWAEKLERPEAHWQPPELVGLLQDVLTDIRVERNRLQAAAADG